MAFDGEFNSRTVILPWIYGELLVTDIYGEFTSRTVTLAASCTEVNPAFWKMWCIHGIRR
jgi:hypothetical protein